MARRVLATGAAIAVLVAGFVLFKLFPTTWPQSTARSAPTTTATTTPAGPPTFDAPPGTEGSIDASNTGAPAVSWTVSGTCSRSGRSFVCRVSVMASNHMPADGYVGAFPGAGHGAACEGVAELSHSSATVSGSCDVPFASKVRVVYSFTSNVDTTAVTQATVRWSGEAG